MVSKVTIGIVLLLLLGAIPVQTTIGAIVTDGIRFQHDINGMILETSYTTKYGAAAWKITDNKSLNIKLEVKSQPTDVVLYMENMHADVTLHAYREQLDGILQDTMDDRLHTGTYPGFNIDVYHPYTEIFSIEGYSQWLIEGWMWYCGSFGSGGISSNRLTENNLIRYDVVGSQITIVYDILVEQDGKIYKTSIIDDFYVFLNSEYNTSGFAPESLVEETKVVTSEVPGFPPVSIAVGVLLAAITIIAISRRRISTQPTFLKPQ